MLKYSTYKSIYSEPVKKPVVSAGTRSAHFSINVKRTLLVALLLLLTCTGVVSAFTSSNNSNDSNSTQKKSLKTVIVMPGDTLWEIATEHKPQGKDIRRYIYSMKQINDLHMSSIQPGEVLILPE